MLTLSSPSINPRPKSQTNYPHHSITIQNHQFQNPNQPVALISSPFSNQNPNLPSEPSIQYPEHMASPSSTSNLQLTFNPNTPNHSIPATSSPSPWLPTGHKHHRSRRLPCPSPHRELPPWPPDHPTPCSHLDDADVDPRSPPRRPLSLLLWTEEKKTEMKKRSGKRERRSR